MCNIGIPMRNHNALEYAVDMVRSVSAAALFECISYCLRLHA